MGVEAAFGDTVNLTMLKMEELLILMIIKFLVFDVAVAVATLFLILLYNFVFYFNVYLILRVVCGCQK